ncbi:AAA domain-containing protein [Endozoicomonas sp. 4G]|uniref:DEAD/DEAH box helicase n=1 Tax=Endozoicomonas sp. 4G TaxID=2872754 RepID=UPI002078B254|nr:AAA domain-containing protein [Endozoicomonas sp. 4G]
MTNIINKSLQFWPEQKVEKYNSEIPLLYKEDRNYLDQNWPDNGPNQALVIGQLKSATKGWVSSFKSKGRDDVKISLLISKYKIIVNIGCSNGNSRLWLSKISFATNRDRQEMLERGSLVSFEGVSVITGRDFGSGLEKQSNRYSTGKYANELLEIINSPWNAGGEKTTQESTVDELSVEMDESVNMLRSFINAEHEIEQVKALQCPPFSAKLITALSKRTTYRLHYEITIDESDYKRLCEEQPGLLLVLSEQREPIDILLEVVDLNPISKEPVIHVSIEKQTSDIQIPSEGMLGIAALPTLSKVRNAVVDSLKDQSSKNPWLLPLIAEEYEHKPLKPVNVPIPPSKFPPTPSQVKAINSGAGSDDYTLVLGPPGTGKTTVILQWVKYFAQQGHRVLVTSQNNKAVDNVLERLAEKDDFECLRIGNENKISSSLEAITLDNKATELQNKMFADADAKLSMLNKQKQLIENIINQKEQISILLTHRDNLDSEYQKLFFSISKIESELSTLTSRQVLLDEEISKLQKKLSDIEGKSWPILKFLSDIYYKANREQLRKKKDVAYRSLSKVSSEILSKRSTLTEHEEQTKKLPDQIEDINRKINFYFSGIYLPIQEIDVPAINLKPISIKDLKDLEDSLQRLMAVIQNLTHWFDKLKNERQQALYKILIENVNVVGATCIGINTKSLFRELDFDVVIVDESGQIQLHNLIVPLSRASKTILVGDHKQLPPVVSDEVLEEIESQGFEDYKDLYRLSWFEHLWENAPEDRKIMLDTQFRCPSIISDFVSEAFYDGQYYAGTGMEKKKPLLSFCPQPMIWIDTYRLPNKTELSFDQDGRIVVEDNVCETKLVVNILEESIKELPELAECREIGIIVPYANHVKAIQKAIRREQKKGNLLELTMPLNELVASVDSFQGQERDLIIFTFTRSNPRGKVGFLSDWRRLNVAQTRAKKQLIMIGDSGTLTKGSKREGAHDVGFKRAMSLLKNKTAEKKALLDASFFKR